MRTLAILTTTAAALLSVNCADGNDPTSMKDDAPRGLASVTGADLDVDGVWDWRETTMLHLRPAAVALFGIAPEGPITTFRCEAAGELTITQNGAQFSGSATQSSQCTTGGGVVFDPSAVFGNSWDLVNGQLQGRSFSFTVATAAFPCPYRGAVRVTGGVVTALQATGHCEVPRELGNDRIWWTATPRP
jgi:hypothetical protein